MKRLTSILGLLFGVIATAAIAQSTPGLYYGQVPTAAQWNSYFAAKQDVLGYTPVNKAGDTMSGRLVTVATAATAGAGLRLPPGVAPTSPTNGDIWTTTAGLYVRVNGSTIGPLVNGTVTSVGLSLPSTFSVSGSPVTTSGTLTATYATQTANRIFAGPTTGSAAAPTFRAMVVADLPALASAHLFVGNVSSIPTDVALSGDVAITNAGVSTVSSLNAGLVAFTGPLTPLKTFTLPNVNTTILTTNDVITLTQGGSGAALTASNGGIIYSTASAMAVLSGTATAGQILRSGASAAPTWSTATYPATAGTSGNVLTSNGTNWVSSTPATGVSSIAGTANEITASASTGAVTLSLPAALTFSGKTVTGGTFSVPTITGGTHTAITSLGIRSTGSGAFDLTLANAENLTAGRTLTLAVGDAARTLTLSGNPTISGVTITGTGTLALGAKTLTASNTITLAGTDGTTMTFPTTNATIARTDAANTFTGTQTIGALIATTVNGNTFTTGTGVLTISAAKTLAATNTITLSGTDGTVMTFPTTNATIARTDAAQTFTGTQSYSGILLGAVGTVGAPQYSFTGRADTGLWSAGAGVASISSGGVETARFANGNNLNSMLQVNSGNSTPFGMQIQFTGAAPNNTTQYFLLGHDIGADRIFIYSNGNLANTNNSYGAISDIRMKTVVGTLPSTIERFRKVRFVAYRLKSDEKASGAKAPIYHGVVAQELLPLFPDLISKDPRGFYQVNYSGLAVEAQKALQDEMAVVDAIKHENAALRNDYGKLAADLRSLKASNDNLAAQVARIASRR